ncbi:unnamed protein product [Allacma fusca]|uniref:Uncharacterized protein n=1 Tax=Allacma fusca TaxID=39272 RepID=A0A8J2K288_9HEXA|nr:unnamed protein product [Allacma fusca]
MQKYGHISGGINQLCMAHAINLGIIDTFYPPPNKPNSDVNDFIDVSEDETSDNEVEESDSEAESETSTQDHSSSDEEDTRIRWSSLFDMLQRYKEVQSSVEKTLIDMKKTKSLSKVQQQRIQPLNDRESDIVDEMIQILEPVKVAVEELSASDINLLGFEEIFYVLLEELSLKTEFGQKLKNNIANRIKERRTIWSKIIYTLHHGIQEEEDNNVEDDELSAHVRSLKVDAKTLKANVLVLLTRLQLTHEDEYPNSDEDITDFLPKRRRMDLSVSTETDISLREKMRRRKELLTKPTQAGEETQHSKSMAALVRDEIIEFLQSGPKAKRGHHLQLAFRIRLSKALS